MNIQKLAQHFCRSKISAFSRISGIFLLSGVKFSLVQSLFLSSVFLIELPQLLAVSFHCLLTMFTRVVYIRVASTKILYALESREYLIYEKILDQWDSNPRLTALSC